MSEMETNLGKIKAFFLIRDKSGKPVFDNWFNIPPEIAHALTDEDWKYIEEMRDGRNSQN